MRLSTWAVALLALAVVGVAGCVTGGGQLENTVYDTHRRVADMHSKLDASLAKMNETNAGLLARLDANEQQLRAVQSALDENQAKLAGLQSSLDSLTGRLYRSMGLSQPAASGTPGGASELNVGKEQVKVVPPPTAPAVPAPTVAPAASAAPEEGMQAMAPLDSGSAPAGPPKALPSSQGSAEADYQQAVKSFATQDYAAALEQFDAFLQRYGDSERSANAKFWKAKSLQGLGRYDQAVAEYDDFRTKYGTNKYISHAMHEQAICHARLGQTARAVELLQQVIKDYPMTPAADLSKTDLKKLQGE